MVDCVAHDCIDPNMSHAGGSVNTSGRTDCGKLMSRNSRARGPRYTAMRKWNSCEFKNLILTMMEFLNSCQHWENASLFGSCCEK